MIGWPIVNQETHSLDTTISNSRTSVFIIFINSTWGCIDSNAFTTTSSTAPSKGALISHLSTFSSAIRNSDFAFSYSDIESSSSYFPIDLQNLAFENQIEYIQIGTDCVFSGNDGSYTETSFMDATDLYGKSKIVGEIEGTNKSLIRSSIIGPEQSKGFSLMNWFLNNTQQEISGYKNHLWNGVTTLNFAKVVEGFILSNEFNFKTQHLIPRNTITKANLLEEFKKHFNKDIVINHIDAEEIIDRTLLTINEQVNENLWKRAGYSSIPTVEENIEELANSEITHKIMKL